MFEAKNRYHLYRMSQSPQERENRLRSNIDRKQSKISSESSEIHDERVKNNKTVKRNLRDESSMRYSPKLFLLSKRHQNNLKKIWRRKIDIVNIDRLNLYRIEIIG